MSKHTDKANRMYYTYRIDNRLYLLRKKADGTFYVTHIKVGQQGHCMLGIVCMYKGAL